VIRLITDGALPHPAKCASCGYGGLARAYFWFKYKEKWGQVLLCTDCMREAASLSDFVAQSTYDFVLQDNARLRNENARLVSASAVFRERFATLVADFLIDLSSEDGDAPVHSHPASVGTEVPVSLDKGAFGTVDAIAETARTDRQAD
jgi:hypothetical protein